MPPRARWGTYQTIAETLRARLSGAVPGSAVPSEAELKEEFGVSRTLVRRALGLLEGEGLVRAVPGRGRVVAAAEPPEPGGRQQMVSELRRRVSELDAGARLPSEAALGDEFGVSRGTARAALAVLAGEGLVYSKQGLGWFARGRSDFQR